MVSDAFLAQALKGDGHFTTMLIEGGKVRGPHLHAKRLQRDHRTLFGTDLDLAPIAAELEELAAQPSSFVARVSVFEADHLITTRRVPSAGPISCELFPLQRSLSHVKHFGLAPQWHARRAVAADDAICCTGLDKDDLVLEGTMFNVGFIRADGRLVWPEGPVLAGTTWKQLEGVWDCENRPVCVGEIGNFVGAIATNATSGVRPITTIAPRLRCSQEGLAWANKIAKAYQAIPAEDVTQLSQAV
ncbi:MAG: aminotransferase class IV [Winkia neuii]|nr:aminotransferase class IV [Winkia neuii]OFJ68831.1 hypothetical protein HMPREF2851_01460 [Actinomyces sp. HMSC064C12]OFK04082.1 hypothetical protein HMPREF2835_01305 [Actinomyces sp. HMSC072A03]OFT54915.1 hypothetical protein HMPREF3152_07475 [Actinomyces sp. HMSC06A08]KWZ75620.1 hypothetical protein HMPREF3198_00011 [Winkia neuii]MDK8100543.1 aminotransferase class IV [Winkia neuii]